MAINNTAIAATSTPIYTSVGNNAITTIIVCNKIVFDAANPLTGLTALYLHAVPSGGSVTDTNLIVNGLPIPAGETVSFDQEKMVLANGDMLIARSDSPANLVVTVSTLAV
jgi:hypothetical protein